MSDMTVYYGIWWDMMGYDGIWWDMMDMTGYDGIWWNMMEYDGIWWNMCIIWRKMSLPRTFEICLCFRNFLLWNCELRDNLKKSIFRFFIRKKVFGGWKTTIKLSNFRVHYELHICKKEDFFWFPSSLWIIHLQKRRFPPKSSTL